MEDAEEEEFDILSLFETGRGEEGSPGDLLVGQEFKDRLLELRTSNPESFEVVQQQFFEKLLTLRHVACPCCTRRVKMFKRKLNSGMASILVWIYRVTPTMGDDEGWLHVTKTLLEHRSNAVAKEYSKLRFWGLLEPRPKGLEDREKRGSGYWRITQKGRAFCRGEVSVPRHAYIFDNQLFGHGSEETTLREALGDRFDWDELMSGTFEEVAALLRADSGGDEP
jgi:hypothetical protein